MVYALETDLEVDVGVLIKCGTGFDDGDIARNDGRFHRR